MGVVTTSSTGKRYEAEDAAIAGRAGAQVLCRRLNGK